MNFLLIGRPNAGKSSLYNILTSGKNNIIHKEEGTTRDWHKSSVKDLENIFIYDTLDRKKIDILQRVDNHFITYLKEKNIYQNYNYTFLLYSLSMD